MGKKRIVTSKGQKVDKSLKARALARTAKRKLVTAIAHIQSTFNNTIVTLTDIEGGVVASSTSGSLGFKGAKKGTPYAAAEVGKVVAERAALIGIKELHIVVRGIGSGREAAIRSLGSHGFDILSIQDKTPVPHNGPRPKKARRV